jgi:hypothetical protein
MVSTGSPIAPYDQHDNGAADDWASQIADTIENVVGSVRDKTTGPLLTVARGVVYGTFGGVVGIAVFLLLIITLVRLFDSVLPDSVFGEDHIWFVYLVVGLLFSIAGAVLWRQRRPREETVAAER